MEGFKVSDIYQGGYNSLDSNKGEFFSGYHARASEIGSSTNPGVANQIGEINKILNQGIVPLEMGGISQQVFDSIPKQHFKEIGRLSKLTGSKISIHAPIQGMEPSGIGQDGWSEENRMMVERQLSDVVRKSFDVDSKGGVPITVHSTELPGSIYNPRDGTAQRIVAIRRDDPKQMIALEREEMYTPEGGLGQKKIFHPEDRLESANRNRWDESLTTLHLQKKTVNDSMREAVQAIAPMYDGHGRMNLERGFGPEQERALKKMESVRLFLDDATTGFNSAFNLAAQYSQGKEDKKILQEISNDWNQYKKEIESGKIQDPYLATMAKSQLIDRSLEKLGRVDAPKLYVPIEEFSKEQSSKTFANLALESYQMSKKTGKAPSKIAIENLSPGMAFANAKGLNSLIDSSRKEFVQRAVENRVMSRGEAERKAKEIIGATFDLGHLNIGKKYGFTDEDMVREARELAKNVKHVHLADNFGYADSHLPPGMGNVPNKEILEELERQGFSGTKIVEAGGFVNQFRESPFMYSLSGLGAPMFSYGGDAHWNTSYGLQQGYFSGYGQMLPQNNYEIFGAGFSSLPRELGGRSPGGGSRMSGTPLE